MSLVRAGMSTEADGRSLIRLRFECSSLADWSRIDVSRVPLYLNADAPLACALHETLTLRVAKTYVRLPGNAERRTLDARFAVCGFSQDEALLPESGSFSGYQLLLEYFSFREKFMSVTLRGTGKCEFP